MTHSQVPLNPADGHDKAQVKGSTRKSFTDRQLLTPANVGPPLPDCFKVRLTFIQKFDQAMGFAPRYSITYAPAIPLIHLAFEQALQFPNLQRRRDAQGR